MANISYNPPYQLGQPGSAVVGGGGGGVGFRNPLDAARSAAGGFTPDAQYPDGYLGTITRRGEDKVLGAVQGRMNNRAYQRGVHKGERIDQGDYFWPPEFGPETGLEYEAQGLKWTARGSVVERLAHFGKTDWATPSELGDIYSQYGINPDNDPNVQRPYDPVRAAQLRRYRPSWQ